MSDRLDDRSPDICVIDKDRSFGPRSRGRRRRLLIAWLVICGFGALPWIFGASSAAWQAAGWSLWLPGGGFLAMGGPWLVAFAVTVLLFGLGMLAWQLTGNVVAPAAIWLGSAVLAGLLAPNRLADSAPLMVAGVASLAVIVRTGAALRAERRRRTRGRRRNAEMSAAYATFRTNKLVAPERNDRELSAEDLAALRGVLDLCLQPVGELAGFDMVDPRFQPAALRYQLNKSQHAMSVAQCQYTPSFHGYLSEAQRFTIESLTLPQVCGYWMLESMWGLLRWHPDPVDTKDNIMLTGWSGHCIGTYTANTGDMRYTHSGALAFRPFKHRPTKTYPHSFHDFVVSLRRNWESAPYFLYPCEPNFSYPVCNLYGYGAVVTYDRIFGTTYAADVFDRFHESLHGEFELADGDITPVLSDWTGLTLLFRPSLALSVSYITLLNAFEPQFAERCWAVTRHERLHTSGDGRLDLQGLQLLDKIDPGSYRAGQVAFTLAWIAAAAHEMGDDRMADLALAEIDARYPRAGVPEVLAYDGVSVLTTVDIVLARILRRNYWRDTVVKGPGANSLNGPLLTDCAYPDVLVARAFSNDGADLELVLRPGSNAGSLQTIQFGQLKPGTRYRVACTASDVDQELKADANGVAQIAVRLHARTEVKLSPAT